jgi:hypothetical protein
MQVERTPTAATDDQQFMPDQRGFGDNETEPARPYQPGRGDTHMN